KLTRTLSERMDAEPGSETDTSLKAVAADTEAVLRRLTAERADLDIGAAPGLSPEQAQAVRDFAAEVRYGFEHGERNDADKPRIFRLIQLRGKVWECADGVRIGRSHRYDFDWHAAIPLLNGINDTLLPLMTKSSCQSYTPSAWDSARVMTRLGTSTLA